MEPATHLDVLSERVDALVGTAAHAMDAPVPTCPDWTLADLVVHMGLVWGWAAGTVATKARADSGQAPDDRSDQALCSWAKGEAARLVGTLRAADPDAGCWTFGPPPSVRFWFRRQALETVLHAWDTERAVGTPSPIDPRVAVDGVDEHLEVMVPRSVARRPGGWTGQTLHLHCTDADADADANGEWLLRLGPDGDVTVAHEHAKADVALRGAAASLWLWCTNRATPEELDIELFGNEEIAARWRREVTF